MLTQSALVEDKTKALVESPCKVLIGNMKHESSLYNQFSVYIIPDNAPSVDYSSAVTQWDWSHIYWRDQCKFDVINDYGSAFLMFSDSPENTNFHVRDDQIMDSGITKGWHGWLMAQSYIHGSLQLNYGTHWDPPWAYWPMGGSGGVPIEEPGAISSGTQGNILGFAAGPTDWTSLYGGSGWNIFQDLVIARAKIYYNGGLPRVPYCFLRIRYAWFGIVSGVGSVNPAIYRVDAVETGWQTVTGGHAEREVTFPDSEPFPYAPFDVRPTAITNPLSHDTLTETLPLLMDQIIGVYGYDPTSWADQYNIPLGHWVSPSTGDIE